MVPITELKRRFRQLRERRNLTQQEFAALAGFDYKFYQYLESPRKKQVWLETVDRIATAHELDTWQLLHADYLRYATALKKNRAHSLK